ncbi:MAG: hypothetical protein NTW17_01555 [Candidatus Pacearchaeota archaeon]|nr:hypothetical protein [Candidatus Pacearchaeota archaeon]
MFGWLFRKKEVEQLKDDTKKSFESVKKDVNSVGVWIKHLDSENNLQKKDIEEIKDVLSSVKEEVEGLKNIISVMNELKSGRKNQTPKQLFDKQPTVYAVQTGVQTGVQTPNFDQFSVTERALIWVLLNSDLKLGYDDLAAMLGKERSTIRGHLNRIKQKSNGIIEEVIEKNGKKRVFVPDIIKEKLLKRVKVRLKEGQKGKK